jgi:hypothetical protein
MIKNIYIYSIIVVAIVGGVIFWASQNGKFNNVADVSTISPSPSSGQSSVPSQTPKLSKNTPKPTPGIVITEVKNYRYWAELLDPISRRLVLDENCTSIVPSQVSYPNNTQIMLDNTYSALPRVLKIGGQEYSLDAGGWLLVTLSSTKLPAQLTMFCGSMELGRLDLE